MKFTYAYKLMLQGQKIRCNKWPLDYYIFIKKYEIHDSMSNLFAYDNNIFFNFNSHILDSSKDEWDIYCDDIESHL